MVANAGEQTVPVTVTFDNGYSTKVDVPVDVKAVAPEAGGTPLTVNQGEKVTDGMVTGHIETKGTITGVEPEGDINTDTPGQQTIPVKVTFNNGTSKVVNIPLTVNPTATANKITVDQGQTVTDDMLQNAIKTDGKIKSVVPVDGPVSTADAGEHL